MDKKVVIVTGANGDIGLPLVNCLVQEGYEVGACVREKTNTDLEENNNLKIFTCDFSNNTSIEACISDLKKNYKNIFGLVNCVGIPHGGSFMMTSIDDINKVFEINYFSIISFSQQIVRKMIKKRTGSIINIASTAAILSDSGTLAYGSSKAALIHSSKVMATELGPFNIRVNAIAPAVVESKMANLMDKASIEALEKRALVTSKILPSEVVDMATYLLSDSSINITGQVIKIDRGITD